MPQGILPRLQRPTKKTKKDDRLGFLAAFSLGLLFTSDRKKCLRIGRKLERTILNPLCDPTAPNALNANASTPRRAVFVRNSDPLEIRAKLPRRYAGNLGSHTSEVFSLTSCGDLFSNCHRFSANFALLAHCYRSQIKTWTYGRRPVCVVPS